MSWCRLFLIFSVTLLCGLESRAQSGQCKVDVLLLNQSRLVANNNLRVECGDLVDCAHTAPWGNWGLDTTADFLAGTAEHTNAFQFAGWKDLDDLLQWNGCTGSPSFAPPDSNYFNYDNYTKQFSPTRQFVVGGSKTFTVSCPDYGTDQGGCRDLDGQRVTNTISAELWELDVFIFPCFWSGNDLVTTIEGTLEYVLSCTVDHCEAEPVWRVLGNDNIPAQWGLEVVFSQLTEDPDCLIEDPNCCTDPDGEEEAQGGGVVR